MGVLVRTSNKRATRILWEAFCVAEKFGYVVKGRKDCRTADKIQTILIQNTALIESDIRVRCDCGLLIKVTDQTSPDAWKIQEQRESSGVFYAFFEDEQFSMLRAHVDAIIPTQVRRSDWIVLQDVLDNADQNWRGSEPVLLLQSEAAGKPLN